MNAKNIDIMLTLALGMLNRAAQINELILNARAQGRDVSDVELDALVAADGAARQKLQEAIDAARAA